MVSAYFVADTIFTPTNTSTQDGIARTLTGVCRVRLDIWVRTEAEPRNLKR